MRVNSALTATAQALAITSNLLAIGIEVGVIVGGYLVYKEVTKKTEASPQEQIVQIPYPEVSPMKEKVKKAKSIIRAILS